MTKTFLLLQLDSEGATYGEVAEILQDMGFKPQLQGFDFVYDWGRDITVTESLGLADRIQVALKGRRVGFRLETSEE